MPDVHMGRDSNMYLIQHLDEMMRNEGFSEAARDYIKKISVDTLSRVGANEIQQKKGLLDSNFQKLFHHLRDNKKMIGNWTIDDIREALKKICPLWPFC